MYKFKEHQSDLDAWKCNAIRLSTIVHHSHAVSVVRCEDGAVNIRRRISNEFMGNALRRLHCFNGNAHFMDRVQNSDNNFQCSLCPLGIISC